MVIEKFGFRKTANKPLTSAQQIQAFQIDVQTGDLVQMRDHLVETFAFGEFEMEMEIENAKIYSQN